MWVSWGTDEDDDAAGIVAPSPFIVVVSDKKR